MEAVIDAQLLDWLQRVDASWVPVQETSRPFDIGKRIHFLTVDIITKICLGTPLGCVASDSDKYDFLATVEQGNMVCQYFSVILELNDLMHALLDQNTFLELSSCTQADGSIWYWSFNGVRACSLMAGVS